MSRIKIGQEIEIKRNPIERFLMSSKDFLKDRKNIVVAIVITIFSIIIVLVGAFVYYDSAIAEEKIQFESIIDNYEKAKAAGDLSGVNKSVEELKKLNNTSSFGFAHKMSFYMIGNILFSQEKYEESIKYLKNFSEKTSSDLFAVLAMQKIGFAYENSGKINEAISTFTAINEKYKESVLTDQVFYNLGRLYQIKGDNNQSKQFFNRVITSFPRSSFAAKSKKMLMIGKINK